MSRIQLPKAETSEVLVEPFHVDFTGHLFLSVLGNHLLNAAGKQTGGSTKRAKKKRDLPPAAGAGINFKAAGKSGGRFKKQKQKK